jgi:hypothetical protein
MNKQYRNPVMTSIHETAADLTAAGVMGEHAGREFR